MDFDFGPQVREPHLTADLLRQGWKGLKSKMPSLQGVEDWGDRTGATAAAEGALRAVTPGEPWEAALSALGPAAKLGKPAAKAVAATAATLAGTEDAEAASGMRKVFYDLLRKNAGDVGRAKAELQTMQQHMTPIDRSQATKVLKADLPEAVVRREMMTNAAEPTLLETLAQRRQAALLRPEDAFKIGDVLVPVSGDTTRAGVNVKRAGVDLKKPVELQGGHEYGLTQEAPWASEYAAARSKQLNFENAADQYGGDVKGLHVAMAPEGSHFAKHIPDLWSEMLRSGPDIDPTHMAGFNTDVLRGLNAQQAGFVKKHGRASPQIERGTQGWQGAQHGSTTGLLDENPEVRKALMATAAKPGWAHMGFPDMDNLYAAALDPGLKTGDVGGAVMRAGPGLPLTESSHRTYSWDLPGESLGRLEVPLPAEMVFKDTAAKFPDSRGKMLGSLRTAHWARPVDQQFIDEASAYTESMLKNLRDH